MAFTGPLEDRIAIRELYGMYGDGSAWQATEEWLACWAEEAVWHTHVFTCSGKDEIRAQWNTLWVNFEKVAFLGEIGAIEIDGDRAIGRSVAREIVLLKGGGIYKLVGRYRDQFVRRNGKWLFLRREYEPIVEELPAA